jgi:hypothetical protein
MAKNRLTSVEREERENGKHFKTSTVKTNTKFSFPELKQNIVFKSFLLGVAAICVWRGIWTLLDLHLIPDDPTWSCVVSIMIGMALFLLYSEIQL